METQITKKEILDRLIASYAATASDDVSTVEGSFTFDTLAANAVEFEKTYAEIGLVLKAAFPQSSWGEYLTAKAEEHGIFRQAATNAVVVLTLTGKAGVTVPKGSLFTTMQGVGFVSVADAAIDETSTAEVKASAQNAGAGGNVEAVSITKIPVAIYGVSAVTNKAAAYDGFDQESDEALLKRLLFKVRQPATSGNAYHYQLWATSVAGVGAVKVLPLWAGNGTVKVLVLDANKEAASAELLQKVQAEIDSNAPIGATVTVAAPQLLTIDVSLKVTAGIGNIEGIKQALNEYFKNNAFSGTAVSYAQVGRIILDNFNITGVNDYSNLLINGSNSNIAVTAEQLPVVGQVTIT